MIRELTSDCVHCGFCLPTCPTYVLWREEMDSPRGRIHLMDARLDGTVTLNATVTQHFDRCLGCMACLSSCPSGVRYDRLIESTRDAVEEEYRRPLSESAPCAGCSSGRCRTHAGCARRSGSRRSGASRRCRRRFRPLVELAPRWRRPRPCPTVTPATGTRRARVGLLTGCVQCAIFGDVNAATARVLAAEGFEVVAPRQSCCGALSVHAGRLEEGKRFATALIEVFEDVDLVVVNSSGCGSHLKELGWLLGSEAEAFATKVRDVGELLAETRPRAPRHPLPLRVALQDSCHLRHAQRLPLASLPALARIPGLEVVEPAEQDLCCGSAGIYNVTQPEAARELGDRKAANVLATSPHAFASANPGCLVQLSQALRRVERPLPALHPIELVDASIRNLAAQRLLARARR